MKIAIIAREPGNSPNMADKDAAILDCIATELAAMGAEIDTIGEELAGSYDAICHMSRNADMLDILEKAERKGSIVINSTDSVRSCSRLAFMNILCTNNIPQPPFSIVEEMEALDRLSYPAWIKKADGWSCHKEDVAFARNAGEAKCIFSGMQERGISRALHCMHMEGDLLKFYAIGDEFFRYHYPAPEKSKFGLEAINGTPRHLPFSSTELKENARLAAEAIGLTIYGGDCIVDTDGNIHIIDINDFPSFSAVRYEAAEEIARLIVTTIHNKKNERRR